MSTCPNCQTENNRPGIKYCTACGSPLAQAAAAAQASVAERPTMPLLDASIPVAIEDFTPQIRSVDEDLEVKELGVVPFGPLPEGAFVGNQYLVNQVLNTQAHLNSYSVEDTANGEEYRPVHVIKESDEWQMLGVELDIACLNLLEDGLRPPIHAFQQQIGGIRRYYLVLPQPGMPLANVKVPVEIPKAVNWGITLARGLARVHQHQIAFGAVTKQRIHVEGEQAYLADFTDCLKPGQPEQFFDEVCQLAAILYELITGQEQYVSTVDLPEHLKGIFAQVMTRIQHVGAADFAQALEQSAEQIRRPASIDLRIGRKTDVGMLRQLNEDSLLTLDLVWNNRSISQPMGVYVVADGMGGHEGGEVASGLTIKTIAQYVTQDLLGPTTGAGELPDYTEWLTKTVQAANAAVYEKSQKSRNDMGTTVVIALVVGNEVYIAHVGDSRAYHVTTDSIKAITTDHSLVERLIATKQIEREDARYHPQSNVIYRTIGDKRTIEVDVTEAYIGPGEYLVLCSDGLNGMISDEAMHQIVLNAPSPQVACEELVRAANAAGGEDNVTVIVVKPEALG